MGCTECSAAACMHGKSSETITCGSNGHTEHDRIRCHPPNLRTQRSLDSYRQRAVGPLFPVPDAGHNACRSPVKAATRTKGVHPDRRTCCTARCHDCMVALSLGHLRKQSGVLMFDPTESRMPMPPKLVQLAAYSKHTCESFYGGRIAARGDAGWIWKAVAVWLLTHE
jgi:hypothetical protein